MSIISISQAVSDSTPVADPISPAAKHRQQVVRAFTGTMAFGFVLATLYLGVRIVTSRSTVHTTAPVVKVAAPVAKSVTTPQLMKAPAPVVKAPAPVVKAPEPATSNIRTQQDSATSTIRHVVPKPGEKYVQVAAFGPKALDSYIRQLEGKGLRPLIAPGPSDGIYRILIGPYTNSETLEQTRRTLQVVGMDSIVRAY